MNDTHATSDPRALVDRIRLAIDAHDLEALVDCFEPDVVSDTPAHPARSFRGRGQVRNNWARIFATVPDIRAELVGCAVHGSAAYAEWDWTGTRLDGERHHMRGVTVLGTDGRRARSVRFFMEVVDPSDTNADQAVSQILASAEG